jgi:hypothetical protein
MIACSSTVLVVAAPSPAAADGNLWWTADGVTFAHVVLTGSGQPVSGLVWNDSDRLFYALSSAKVYTSPDGATWTLATTVAGFAFSRSRAEHGIDTSRAVVPMACVGGVVVASGQITTPDASIVGVLAIGYNGGKTWDVIQQTNIVTTEAGTSSSLSAIQAVDGRIVTVRDDDAGGSRGTSLSYSLRTK